MIVGYESAQSVMTEQDRQWVRQYVDVELSKFTVVILGLALLFLVLIWLSI